MTCTHTRHSAATPSLAGWLCVSLALAMVGGSAPVSAQSGTDDLARLLSHQARIEGGSDASLSRVPLTEEVLRTARADLSDVRVVSPQGVPLPYLIDSGARPLPSDVPLRMLAPLVDARESRDGSRREPGLFRERFVIAAPSAAPTGALWFLELAVPHERWVRQVRIIANEGTDTEQLVYEGSLFHLPTPTRARESLSVPNLPAGARVTVELVGDDFFVTPSFTWVARRAYEGAPQLTIPLEIESSRREGSQTLVTLRRPPGVLPDRIRIQTSTLDFHRSVQVRDGRPGEVSRSIGRGEIYRVEMLADAHVDELHVEPARGDTLELLFDDADSPPLADLVVEALVVAPSLVARIPDGSTLRFGGGRVSAPHYDLSALLGRDAGDRLLRSALPTLRLGAVESSPSFDTSPALSFAMHPGRAVEPARYAMRATLQVSDAREGLTRIAPTAALLSAGEVGLGDLRIIDDQSRQWPYFLGDSLVDVEIELSVAPATRHDDWTHVVLTPSVTRVQSHTVTLDIDADYFDRQMRLIGIDSETGEERILVNERVSRTPGVRTAISLAGPGQRVSAWRLEIHDADDAPLALTAARAVARTPEIFLVAPQGAYGVLVGDAEASAPSYELSRVRSIVLQIPAADASVSEVTPNPAHRVPGWYERAGSATLALWAALLLAVLVLGGLTLRLARLPQPAEVETPRAEPDAQGPIETGSAESDAAQPTADDGTADDDEAS